MLTLKCCCQTTNCKIAFTESFFTDLAMHVLKSIPFSFRPYPAPLSLCSISEFDLKNNVDMCPEGRKVLKDFYDTAKGIEWTNSTNWLDEYASICTWHGVGCNKNGEVNYLNLTNNALSGRLIDSIAHLPMLEVIELSDNDIKGTLPSSIGMLHNLTYLRLSYNAFTGGIPPQLGNLQYLQLLHLHGNRFRGEVVPLKSKFVTDSAFVSDCGVPTDFDQPLLCSECTMCCKFRISSYLPTATTHVSTHCPSIIVLRQLPRRLLSKQAD